MTEMTWSGLEPAPGIKKKKKRDQVEEEECGTTASSLRATGWRLSKRARCVPVNGWNSARMASAETPPLSIRHGARFVPDLGVAMEEVLLAVGESIGHDNMCCASRMNKAVVVFMKEEWERTEGSAAAGSNLSSGNSRGEGAEERASKVPLQLEESQPEESHIPPVVEGKSASPSAALETKTGGEQCKIGAVPVDDGEVASTSFEGLGEPVAANSVAGSIGSSVAEPVVPSSQANTDMEEVEYESDVESVSLLDISKEGDLYSLEEINGFLDETFGKSAKKIYNSSTEPGARDNGLATHAALITTVERNDRGPNSNRRTPARNVLDQPHSITHSDSNSKRNLHTLCGIAGVSNHVETLRASCYHCEGTTVWFRLQEHPTPTRPQTP
ncbi:hypothetical protein SKAU_G00014960 [Synaphobranchus kaupii]|uniref:Uncharacterized protein n=1 Tax=Synaphobranchus kaupii TaxID=118154 RepID=A0A9Q1GBX3_SYNKA|nr:hypothetical protein SKAU_G00014960 [Synaphobranchus kaupii]